MPIDEEEYLEGVPTRATDFLEPGHPELFDIECDDEDDLDDFNNGGDEDECGL